MDRLVTLQLDSEIAEFLAAAGRAGQVLAPPPVNDVATLRATTEEGLRGGFMRMTQERAVSGAEV